MLPVVRSQAVVGVQISLYSWALVVSSLLLIPAADMGLIYSAVALTAGAWFLIDATKLYVQSKTGRVENPMRLFHGSISYLTLLFVAVAVDPLIHLSLLNLF